jgi:LysM repeat protein
MIETKMVKIPLMGLALCVAILLALLYSPSIVQAQSPCGASYTVVRGDTLYRIAQRCNTNVQALLRANPAITNPNLIRAGQVITIPSGMPADQSRITVYTVQRGDTLYRLSRRFNTTIATILHLNPSITNPNIIRVGQHIRIPVVATPSHEAAERTGFAFMQAVVKTAPPADPRAQQTAFNLLSRSAQRTVGGSATAANYAFFVGIQDVPDQGISVEDLRINSPTQAFLIVGLNYSGSGRVLRSVNMVVENEEWKVASVSQVDR